MTSVLRAGDLAQLRSKLSTTDDAHLIVDERLVMHDVAFDLLQGSTTSKALVDINDVADVRIDQSFVVDAASTVHSADACNAQFAGALLVSQGDRETFIAALDGLQANSMNADGNLPMLLVAAIRSGIPVAAAQVPALAWSFGDESVRNEWTTERVAKARSLAVNRARDGFYSTFVVRKLSTPLTTAAVRLGIAPNAITVISLFVALAAAALFSVGTFWPTLIAAIALQLSLVIDCVDGEVARATGKFSKVGAWLDASTDRIKEFVVYFGLAVGAWRMGTDAWVLAALMVTVQTFRHMGDYDFQRVLDLRTTAAQRRPITQTTAAEVPGGFLAWSSRANQRPAVVWMKRVIHLPIGERWLIISVFAILLGPLAALVALFVAQLIALGYVMASRIVRTRRWQGRSPGLDVLQWQADGALLPSLSTAFVRAAGKWDWLAPAILRFVEFIIVCVVALRSPSIAWLALAWLVVISYHHYDVLYRSLLGHRYPAWLTFAGLGWDGRTVLVIVMGTLLVALWPVAILLAFVLFWIIASAQWLARMRSV